jgi:hypothetical protein
VYSSLVEILEHMATTGRIRVRATNLKDQLLVRLPGFSERKYGFSKFKDLLLAAERTGLVTVSAAGPVHWVSLPNVDAEPTAAVEAPTLAPAVESVSTAAAAVSVPDEAEQAAQARERRLAVVRYVDGLRERSRWLTYTYVLTNVIGFIGRIVPPAQAEHEARSILNYLVAEGALRIDKVPQEVDVGGIKHRVRMCHFVDDHTIVREARAIPLEEFPAELVAEMAPAAEAAPEVPAVEREPLEHPQTPAGEPSLELREVTVSPDQAAEISGDGRVSEEAVETAAAEVVVDEPAPEAPEAPAERSSRRRGRGGRRSRGAAARQAAEGGDVTEAAEVEAAPPQGEEGQAATGEPEAAPAAPDVALEPAPEAVQPAAEQVVEVPAELTVTPPPPETAEAVVVAPPTLPQVFGEARRILVDLAGQGKARVTGSSLKLRLGRLFPGFDERKYGFTKFRDFLQAAERDGYARLEMEGQVSWVRPPRPAEETTTAPAEGTDEVLTGDANAPAESAGEAPAAAEGQAGSNMEDAQ